MRAILSTFRLEVSFCGLLVGLDVDFLDFVKLEDVIFVGELPIQHGELCLRLAVVHHWLENRLIQQGSGLVRYLRLVVGCLRVDRLHSLVSREPQQVSCQFSAVELFAVKLLLESLILLFK